MDGNTPYTTTGIIYMHIMRRISPAPETAIQLANDITKNLQENSLLKEKENA